MRIDPEDIYSWIIFLHLLLILLTVIPGYSGKLNLGDLGADLYKYLTPKTSWRARMEEGLRRMHQAFLAEVTAIKGDYELAREWRGAKGTHRWPLYSTPLRTGEISNIVNGSHKGPQDALHPDR